MGRELIEENGKYAVRETVTDEEIVTPWFDNTDDLAKHLVEFGDAWGTKAKDLETAKEFIRIKFVPSMIMIPGVGFFKNYDCAVKEAES